MSITTYRAGDILVGLCDASQRLSDVLLEEWRLASRIEIRKRELSTVIHSCWADLYGMEKLPALERMRESTEDVLIARNLCKLLLTFLKTTELPPLQDAHTVGAQTTEKEGAPMGQ